MKLRLLTNLIQYILLSVQWQCSFLLAYKQLRGVSFYFILQIHIKNLIQDVVMKWLTTDDIELNTIDAEDPEISDYHMLPNTEKLSDRYKSDIVFPLYVIFCLADLAAWFCSQKFWSKFSCWVIKSNRAGEVCFFLNYANASLFSFSTWCFVFIGTD